MNAAARQYYEAGIWQMRRDTGADAAVDSMQKAVAADPDSALTHSGQAEAWWWKYFVTKDQKYLNLCEQELAEARRRNGDLAPVHRLAGILLYRNDMPGEAIPELLRSVELEPTDGDGHRALAIAFTEARQFDKAVAEYRRSIELDPTTTAIIRHLARTTTIGSITTKRSITSRKQSNSLRLNRQPTSLWQRHIRPWRISSSGSGTTKRSDSGRNSFDP